MLTARELLAMHDSMGLCPLCKDAGAQSREHYALGRLRLQMGKDLGLNLDTTLQLDFSTLLGRWHSMKAGWRPV